MKLLFNKPFTIPAGTILKVEKINDILSITLPIHSNVLNIYPDDFVLLQKAEVINVTSKQEIG